MWWQWERMSTSFPPVSEGTSICHRDALSAGANSITQCPASLSLSATLAAVTPAACIMLIYPSSQQRLEHNMHTRTRPVTRHGPRSIKWVKCMSSWTTNSPTVTQLMRDLHQHLWDITPSPLSIYLSDSYTHSLAGWSSAHTLTHHTPTHITLTRAHSNSSLPLYICSRSHCNGCTSSGSFSAATRAALSLMSTFPPFLKLKFCMFMFKNPSCSPEFYLSTVNLQRFRYVPWSGSVFSHSPNYRCTLADFMKGLILLLDKF